MIPTLIIVGADKGGVGKTTVSRVLLDYLKDRGAKPKVFDTEGALHRFYHYAKVIDISQSLDQAEIFDGVQESGMTVVDMKAGTLSSTLRKMRNAGKLEKVDQGDERLMIFHVLGSSQQSMDEIIDTHALLGGGAEHILIENQAGSDGTFFKWDTERYGKFFESVKPQAKIMIPHLDTVVAEDVDMKGMPFSSYIANMDKKNSDWLVRQVRYWRSLVYKALDETKVL